MDQNGKFWSHKICLKCQVAIKKLTDDFNALKNTYIIFNVHSKKKQIFVQQKCTITWSESNVN